MNFWKPYRSRWAACWFLFATVAVSLPGYAQEAKLDSVLRSIKFKNDSIRAIFDWVVTTMKYDTSLATTVHPSAIYGPIQKQDILDAISQKKGVCYHYSLLFNELLRRAGFESYLVEGYTRETSHDRNPSGHLWNLVRVSGKWYFFDPTWASGYVLYGTFFRKIDYSWYKISPGRFIHTHIPFDPVWQMLSPGYSLVKNKLVRKRSQPISDIGAAIRSANSGTMQQRMSASITRIKDAGHYNKAAKTYLANMQNFIENERNYQYLRNQHRILNCAVSLYKEYHDLKRNHTRDYHPNEDAIKNVGNKMRFYIDSLEIAKTSSSFYDVQNALYASRLKFQISEFLTAYHSDTW